MRPRPNGIPRLAALLGLLAMAHPTTVRAQENGLLPAAWVAEIRAVPLTMDLSRRAYGVTTDLMALGNADPKLRKAFFATMRADLDETVRMLDGQPKIVPYTTAPD